MRILQHLKDGLTKMFGTGTGSVKSSVQDFVGDFVIRSTVNRLKSGILSYLGENTATPPASPTAQEDQSVDTAVTAPGEQGSHTLMSKLMANLSEPVKKAAKQMVEQADNTLLKVGGEIAEGLKQTAREKVEKINADDVLLSLARILNASSEPAKADQVQSNPQMNIEAAKQFFGWALLVIGLLLIANGLGDMAQQEKLRDEVQEPQREPALAF
ncbi:Dot/Icm secretion system substrate [Legionella adelaidensis]|uniref:Dot/Icm secretion system substrate n=1 Tax=Legionella adelaidensis TaxID=45056 RepID=A0A0W0R6G1_9GAMM|nr:hypothetical protein [Legionella adelaidensis]KTC66634.1 Dot/Icm secretion system substrate [Legionella adelaidensis]VEH81023.1 Dot/Icm secretion system substrate [Legionella adelaidensis]